MGDSCIMWCPNLWLVKVFLLKDLCRKYFCGKILQKENLSAESEACWRKKSLLKKILRGNTSFCSKSYCRKYFGEILLQKIFLMISLQKIFLWTAQTERRLLTPWYNSCDFVTYGAGFVQPKTMALLVWCIWPKYFYLATKNIVCRQDLSRRESNTIHWLQLATFKTMLIVFRNLLSPRSILIRTDKISTR